MLLPLPSRGPKDVRVRGRRRALTYLKPGGDVAWTNPVCSNHQGLLVPGSRDKAGRPGNGFNPSCDVRKKVFVRRNQTFGCSWVAQ